MGGGQSSSIAPHYDVEEPVLTINCVLMGSPQVSLALPPSSVMEAKGCDPWASAFPLSSLLGPCNRNTGTGFPQANTSDVLVTGW